jgi:photosystem II stability/assembly factor-like uncharacterized protein
MATYLAVGDAGRILCDGTGCSGAQDSGTDEVLFGAARSSFTFSNGVLLRLVVGEDGTILRMRAGGRWRQFSSGTTRNLNDVSIAPGTGVAWAVGDEGTILKSSDAGANWGFQAGPNDFHLRAVHALSEEIAWAAGDHAIVLLTTDGGVTWKRPKGPSIFSGGASSVSTKHLKSIFGLDHNRALAVGDDGTYLECNVVKVWQFQKLTSKDLTGIADRHGFITAVTGTDGLIRTREPGGNWKTRNTETSKNLHGIVINGDRIIAVGDDGLILISPDRGATWIHKTRGTKHLHGVA